MADTLEAPVFDAATETGVLGEVGKIVTEEFGGVSAPFDIWGLILSIITGLLGDCLNPQEMVNKRPGVASMRIHSAMRAAGLRLWDNNYWPIYRSIWKAGKQATPAKRQEFLEAIA